MMNHHNSFDFPVQNNQNMNLMEMNGNQQFNFNNNLNNDNMNINNQFNDDISYSFGMNNFNSIQQMNYNSQTNVNNQLYQKIRSSPVPVNNLNSYNTEINRSFSNNIPFSNGNRILDDEFQIPKYFNGKSNSQENNIITGYIKGKKLEYPKDKIGLL